MAHLKQSNKDWQDEFPNDQEDEDEGESQYDEDFEQEEVLGDDHDIYGFEDDAKDDQEYYEGYGDGSDDFDNVIDAPHINNGRSSGGSSQYNDPLAIQNSNKKNSSGFGQDSVLQTTAQTHKKRGSPGKF